MTEIPELIYEGSSTVPLAEVQHISLRGNKGGIMVVMKSTTWNAEIQDYNNGIYFAPEEAPAFRAAFCKFLKEAYIRQQGVRRESARVSRDSVHVVRCPACGAHALPITKTVGGISHYGTCRECGAERT